MDFPRDLLIRHVVDVLSRDGQVVRIIGNCRQSPFNGLDLMLIRRDLRLCVGDNGLKDFLRGKPDAGFGEPGDALAALPWPVCPDLGQQLPVILQLFTQDWKCLEAALGRLKSILHRSGR